MRRAPGSKSIIRTLLTFLYPVSPLDGDRQGTGPPRLAWCSGSAPLVNPFPSPAPAYQVSPGPGRGLPGDSLSEGTAVIPEGREGEGQAEITGTLYGGQGRGRSCFYESMPRWQAYKQTNKRRSFRSQVQVQEHFRASTCQMWRTFCFSTFNLFSFQ